MDELRGMLSETLDDAREREQRLVGELNAKPDTSIVLFGAGRLGRRTLALLRDHGHDVAAFIDNDNPRCGDGARWRPGAIAGSRHRHGSPRMVSRSSRSGEQRAATTSWKRVKGCGGGAGSESSRSSRCTGDLRADALPYITIDLPTKVLAARDDVIAATGLWSDERSLREYVSQVRWRLTGDFAALSPPVPDQYFAEGLVRVGPDEVFVDCGAFTGDTMLDVAGRVDSWRAYHAFEPDPASFAALRGGSRRPCRAACRARIRSPGGHRGSTMERPTSMPPAGLCLAFRFRRVTRSNAFRSTTSWPIRRRHSSRWTSRELSRLALIGRIRSNPGRASPACRGRLSQAGRSGVPPVLATLFLRPCRRRIRTAYVMYCGS